MRKSILIIAILLIVAGIAVLFYPKTSDLIFQQQANKQYQTYKQTNCTAELNYQELHKKLNLYNKHLYESLQVDLKDPWSYEQPGFDLTEYGFSENIIGFVRIESLDIKLPIYLGASKTHMDSGVALITQTSIPIGGKNTNAVLAAHRGMIKAKMFRDIDDLHLGDQIIIESLCEKLTYEVKSQKIINANDVSEILIHQGKDMVTLISCDGPNNSQRIVVYCERVNN